jgi:hypothetical protein
MYAALRASLWLFTKIDGFNFEHHVVCDGRRASHTDVTSKSAGADLVQLKTCRNDGIKKMSGFLSLNAVESSINLHGVAVLAH